MSILNEIEAFEDRQLLTEVSNEEVVRKFMNNEFAHNKEEAPKYGVKTDSFSPIWGSASLKITRIPVNVDEPVKGWSLNFNALPILFMDENDALYFNEQKYGMTSISKVQTLIRGVLEGDDKLSERTRKVDGDTMKKLVKGEKVDTGVLDTLADEIPEPEATE